MMLRYEEGMTAIWNRLTDPSHDAYDAPDTVELRALRDAMDRAVLAAYGWSDVEPADRERIVARLRERNAAYAAEEEANG